jgi:hypothetical protein
LGMRQCLARISHTRRDGYTIASGYVALSN